MKPTSISGFPEWLPEQRITEDRVIASIKEIYTAHGFSPIETPAVELLSTLAAKGGDEKEIFAVKRAKSAADEEAELALHFDLTVPLARYVALHFNELTFPFRRYQLQKVWRGERPQKGRFREFYQFDIDIIAVDDLPLACDGEILSVVHKAVSGLGLGEHVIRLNNRKILTGFYASFGMDAAQSAAVITVVDKIEKIGPDGVVRELVDTLKVASATAEKIVSLASRKLPAAELGDGSPLLSLCDDSRFAEGVRELVSVVSPLTSGTKASLQVDMSIARGLGYYTGTVFETYFLKNRDFGSVCSGGRYENLASEFIRKKLPGVGGSIGLTRLMDLVFREKLLPTDQLCLSDVLVTVFDESQRQAMNELADQLRAEGVRVEVYFKAPKIGKQIEYADKKGIRYVLFADPEKGTVIKDLKTQAQTSLTDIKAWAGTLRR